MPQWERVQVIGDRMIEHKKYPTHWLWKPKMLAISDKKREEAKAKGARMVEMWYERNGRTRIFLTPMERWDRGRIWPNGSDMQRGLSPDEMTEIPMSEVYGRPVDA